MAYTYEHNTVWFPGWLCLKSDLIVDLDSGGLRGSYSDEL